MSVEASPCMYVGVQAELLVMAYGEFKRRPSRQARMLIGEIDRTVYKHLISYHCAVLA